MESEPEIDFDNVSEEADKKLRHGNIGYSECNFTDLLTPMILLQIKTVITQIRRVTVKVMKV